MGRWSGVRGGIAVRDGKSDVFENPVCLGVSFFSTEDHYGESIDVDPGCVRFGVIEFPSTPGAECDDEATALHGGDGFTSEGDSGGGGGVVAFGGVLGDVASGVLFVADQANVDDPTVAGDSVPLPSDGSFFHVAAFGDDVEVGVPSESFGDPLDLEEGETAGDVAFPELTLPESAEGFEEAIEACGEGLAVGL